MTLTTKYSCGDKVFPIGYGPTQKRIPCPLCKGTARVPIAGSCRDATCPDCVYGWLTVVVDPLWTVGQELTVGMVRAEYKDSPGRDGEDTFDNYKAQKGVVEQYMCVETGIGSGYVFDVERLWPTMEEAQAECDRLNREGVEP